MTLPAVEYQDRVYTVTVTSDIVYNANPTLTDLQDSGQLLDLYGPANCLYTSGLGGAGAALVAANRPLLVWAHGGGFTQGSKTNSDAVYIAESFASMGYRVASINYRMFKTLGNKAWGTWVGMGVEDMRAALRHLIFGAAGYFIDTTRILVGGDSAGGAIAAFSLLSNQEVANSTLAGENALMGAGSKAHGLLGCWGAYVGQSASTGTFALDNATVIANATAGLLDKAYLVHGDKDETVLERNSIDLEYLVGSTSGWGKLKRQSLRSALHGAWYRGLNAEAVFSEGYKEDSERGVAAYFKSKLGL